MANQSTVVLSLVDAVLKRGTPNTTTLPAATLVTTVKNVNLKLTMEEAEASNRNSAFRQYLPSLAGIELQIEFNSDSADTHLAAGAYCPPPAAGLLAWLCRSGGGQGRYAPAALRQLTTDNRQPNRSF